MLQSQLFAKTKKEVPREAEIISHQLLLRGDFIEQVAAGVYSFLPLGLRVLKKIEEIIRKEMIAIGAQELLLPALIPKSLWERSKRWQEIDPPLFKVKDRHGKLFGLGSTHEEVITSLVAKRMKSYKDLPQALFQIQTKFRNEMRPTSGLLRTREFLMKDLYSFHRTEREAQIYYHKVKKAYFKIYRTCRLEAFCVEADPGTIGGAFSHEFMILSEAGEDRVAICEKCHFGANIEKLEKKEICHRCGNRLEEKNSIEVGHIFYLGEKYSQILGAHFTDKKGKLKNILMGCYGIGLGRLLATIVELHHDERGIIWPLNVAPFMVHLIALEAKNEVQKVAEKLYKDLQKVGIEVLYDERKDKTAGEKFADCDLIGIPWRLVISEKSLKERKVELKKRNKKKIKLLRIREITPYFIEKLWQKRKNL